MNKTVIGLALIVLVGGVFLYQVSLNGKKQEIEASSGEVKTILVPESFGGVVSVSINDYVNIVVLFENGVYVSRIPKFGSYRIVYAEGL